MIISYVLKYSMHKGIMKRVSMHIFNQQYQDQVIRTIDDLFLTKRQHLTLIKILFTESSYIKVFFIFNNINNIIFLFKDTNLFDFLATSCSVQGFILSLHSEIFPVVLKKPYGYVGQAFSRYVSNQFQCSALHIINMRHP